MPISTGPATGALAVTPSDTQIVGASALYIGVTGDVTIDTDQQTSVLFKAHPVGYLPCRALRVKATGTTATSIVALF